MLHFLWLSVADDLCFLEIGAGSQTFASIMKRIDWVICGQRVYLKITHIRASI